MGSTRWSSDAYLHLKKSYSSKSREEIFSSKSMSSDMSPVGLKFREARDSEVHPESLPIIVGLDVTGSMGHIPEFLIKEKLGTLIETLITHAVKDPAVLFCALGDHRVDNAPLQIGQFESGTIELNKWLTTTWLEGGGGDAPESYGLAHIFASKHTSIDSFEKRKTKGFLFTVGDQAPHLVYEGEYLAKIFGSTYQKGMNIKMEECIEAAKNQYHVIHINIKEISDASVTNEWKKLLGQNVIEILDYKLLAEVIASTVAIYHGVSLEKITSGFEDRSASEVKTALAHISTGIVKPSDKIIEL